MKLNNEIGKIYDTIFFLTYHYYEDEIISQCFKLSDNIENDIYYLKIMKEKNINISNNVSIFFYKDNNYHSLMSDFMFDFLNFEKDSFDNLIQKLNNRKFFKQYFVTKYLSQLKGHEMHCFLNNINPRFIYSTINTMNMPDSFKFQFKMTLDLFDEMVDELIKTLKIVYHEVCLMHDKHHQEILEFLKECNKKEKKHKLSIFYAINLLKLEKGMISYTFFSPYVIALKMKEIPFFILGKKAFCSLDKDWDFRHISWNSISKIMIDPAKVKIIELFYSQQEYSSPQICKILHYAKSTVAHHIDMLLAEKIIFHTKTEKRTFYYKINPEYFDALVDFVKKERLKAHGLKIAVNK